jgi:hypothetical protein
MTSNHSVDTNIGKTFIATGSQALVKWKHAGHSRARLLAMKQRAREILTWTNEAGSAKALQHSQFFCLRARSLRLHLLRLMKRRTSLPGAKSQAFFSMRVA